MVDPQSFATSLISLAKEWSAWMTTGLVIIVTVLIYKFTRKIVKISCFIGQPIPLVSVRKEARDQIKIFYGDKLIENLNLVEIKVRNDGNVSIRKEHVEKPIEFDFGDAEVIDYSVLSTKPEGIDVKLEKEEKNKVKCITGLLNPKDEIKLKFVFIGDVVEPNVSARIEGLRQIDILPEEEVLKSTKLGYSYVILGIILCLISGAYSVIYPESLKSPGSSDLVIMYLFVGISLFVFGILMIKKPKESKKILETILDRWMILPPLLR